MIRVGYELVMCEESLQQQTHLWLRLLQYWEINGCGAVCGILYSTVLVGTISSILAIYESTVCMQRTWLCIIRGRNKSAGLVLYYCTIILYSAIINQLLYEYSPKS